MKTNKLTIEDQFLTLEQAKEKEFADDYSQQLFIRRVLYENFGEGEGEWEY